MTVNVFDARPLKALTFPKRIVQTAVAVIERCIECNDRDSKNNRIDDVYAYLSSLKYIVKIKISSQN